MLCLIEYGHTYAVCGELIEQKPVKTVEDVVARCALGVADPKLRQKRLKHLHAVQKRIENQSRAEFLAIHLVENVAAERGLPHTRLARQHHESFLACDAVQKLVYSFTVLVSIE